MEVLNFHRGGFYLQIIRKDESQERFARGWLKGSESSAVEDEWRIENQFNGISEALAKAA